MEETAAPLLNSRTLIGNAPQSHDKHSTRQPGLAVLIIYGMGKTRSVSAVPPVVETRWCHMFLNGKALILGYRCTHPCQLGKAQSADAPKNSLLRDFKYLHQGRPTITKDYYQLAQEQRQFKCIWLCVKRGRTVSVVDMYLDFHDYMIKEFLNL